jgi:hypothetical protein
MSTKSRGPTDAPTGTQGCPCGVGSGSARTILLFHIISARSSKQSRMVGSTLGVYNFGLIFVSARTNKRHHHHQTDLFEDGSNGLSQPAKEPFVWAE